MSESAFQFIEAFSALSPHERYSVLIEIARIAEMDEGGLHEEELSLSGEQIFALYDAEEAQHGETEAG